MGRKRERERRAGIDLLRNNTAIFCLPGGKLWKGAAAAAAAAGSNLNSSSTSTTTTTTLGEDGRTEKSPAVRFIQLNDALPDDEDSSGGQQASNKAGGHHSSAFQQLFPRARKLLQDLPEAEIQRLTTSARAINASSVISSRTVSSTLHSSDDLKYEQRNEKKRNSETRLVSFLRRGRGIAINKSRNGWVPRQKTTFAF